MFLIFSIILGFIIFYTANITNTVTGEIIEQSIFVHYQLLISLITYLFFINFSIFNLIKIIMFSIYCKIVSTEANKGIQEYINRYNEALHWRQ